MKLVGCGDFSTGPYHSLAILRTDFLSTRSSHEHTVAVEYRSRIAPLRRILPRNVWQMSNISE